MIAINLEMWWVAEYFEYSLVINLVVRWPEWSGSKRSFRRPVHFHYVDPSAISLTRNEVQHESPFQSMSLLTYNWSREWIFFLRKFISQSSKGISDVDFEVVPYTPRQLCACMEYFLYALRWYGAVVLGPKLSHIPLNQHYSCVVGGC